MGINYDNVDGSEIIKDAYEDANLSCILILCNFIILIWWNICTYY